jgi:TonB-dependent SusC/RagA subfamily outer membrane receptor
MLFLFLSFGFVKAQQLEIDGKISDKQTGEPLIGANISIKGTNLGTVSDMEGKFHIKLPHYKSATLVFSYIGYKTITKKVKESQYDMKIEMEPDVLKTSEVVISGLASSVKRENAANSVATVSARELTEVPTQTLDGELSGKFAGVTVSATSGAPGGGFYVNLRGVGTINAESQPLYVLDGVILDNTATQSGVNAVTKATGGGSTNYQDNPVNRIADLVPDDIKSIEVLKGPSAAAIYGAKASNGVVIITTKQGTAGRSSFTFRQQFGVNVLAKKLGSRKFTAKTAKEWFGEVGLKEFLKGKTYDHEEELYGRKGFVNQSSVGIGGGNQRSQYYISLFQRNDQGIIQNTGYSKQSARINLSHKVSERVDVKIFANYVHSSSDRGLTNNDNSGTSFGMALAGTPSFLNLQPVNGVYPENPFVASNPLQTAALMTNNETVDRTIVSGNARFNIVRTEKQLLDFTAVGGIDYYTQINKAVFPRELQFEKYSSQPGTTILGETVSRNSNLYLNLIHNYFFTSDISFRTALGLQFESKNLNHTISVGEDVIIGQENIDQAASVTVDQNRIIQRDRGFFAQEEVSIKDIYFFCR